MTTGKWLALKRWKAGRRSGNEHYKALLEASPPSPATDFDDAELVCLDIETTGLDPATVDMLSIGWVLIRNGRVDLSPTCDELGESPTIHGLTDSVVDQGISPEEAMERVIDVLTGRVLVVHHAGLDKKLLDRLCREQFGDRLLVPVIDTLALENRHKSRHHHLEDTRSLRLPDLRDHYNLPWYRGHDCLGDAIATAELLIAMAASRDSPTTLSDLY
jgi:DNA polymerase-3 subunit epsilon